MALNSELLVGSYNCDGFTSSSTFLHADSYNCRGLPNLVTNDDIDHDNNIYNELNVDSVYYTEDECNDKIVSKVQAASTFSIINFNARSRPYVS